MNDLPALAFVVAFAALAFISVRRAAGSRAALDAGAAAAEGLRAELAALERETMRSKEILERMAEGVLVLDEQLRPATTNSAARDLLGIRDAQPARLPSDEILSLARSALTEDKSKADIVNVWFPGRMSLWVRAAPLEDGGGVVVVVQDVTEELKIQRVRRDFVAHASHELKTPVTALQTLAEALRRAVHDDPQAAERFSRKLVAEAGRLGRLIEDLLDLSKLEETATPPDNPVELSEVAEREVTRLRGATEPATKLVTTISKGVWVKGDEGQLGLVVRNLLENAVRYTPPGGKVTLEVFIQDGDAVIQVGDTGIGIPLEAQARVFERFYRVDRARSRDRGGTGLGLAIVKHVVELHGGAVHLESELGRGSTFSARIPARRAPRARPVRSLAG